MTVLTNPTMIYSKFCLIDTWPAQNPVNADFEKMQWYTKAIPKRSMYLHSFNEQPFHLKLRTLLQHRIGKTCFPAWFDLIENLAANLLFKSTVIVSYLRAVFPLVALVGPVAHNTGYYFPNTQCIGLINIQNEKTGRSEITELYGTYNRVHKNHGRSMCSMNLAKSTSWSGLMYITPLQAKRRELWIALVTAKVVSGVISKREFGSFVPDTTDWPNNFQKTGIMQWNRVQPILPFIQNSTTRAKSWTSPATWISYRRRGSPRERKHKWTIVRRFNLHVTICLDPTTQETLAVPRNIPNSSRTPSLY